MNNYMITCFAALLICAGFCSLEACGQEPSAQQIVDAIEKMSAADALSFSGQIEPKKAEGNALSGGVIMVGQNSGGLFLGKFDVVLDTEQEDLLICSEKELPGVVVYCDGEDVITSQSFRDQSFSTTNMSCDLSQLLDLENLKKFVGHCEQIESQEQNGSLTYSCTLSNRLIRVDSTVGLLVPEIKQIEGEFEIDQDGELTGAKFTVTRKSPMARMIENGTAKIDAANLERVKANLKDDAVTYSLKVTKTPSDRSKAMLEKMRALASEE